MKIGRKPKADGIAAAMRCGRLERDLLSSPPMGSRKMNAASRKPKLG
jgi:hypothetical protein